MKTIGDVSGFTRIEHEERLSHSQLFDLQRAFYQREGASAWASGTVPHYITCNPSIAASYAEVVLAFARDCRAAGQLPRDSRINVIELGSGSGRFGFLFLTRARDLFARSSLADVDVTLTLTDFDDTKFADWRQHPSLQPFFDDGSLDLAVLDGAAPSFTVEGPRVLIANYVLDSLPQDAYAIRQGEVHELLVSLDEPTGAQGLPHLNVSWTPSPTPIANPSPLLEEYAATLDDTAILVPTAAIALLQAFAATDDAPALAITADKGTTRTSELCAAGEPQLVLHGECFSLMVNFDAIRREVERHGGTAFHPPHRHSSIAVTAYSLTDVPTAETASAFDRHVVERGPDDAFTIRAALSTHVGTLTLRQLVAYLHATLDDPAVFQECFSRLLDLAGEANDDEKCDLRPLVDAVWRQHFPIGESSDLALCLGLLLSAIGDQRQAIGYFGHSRLQHGPTANTFFAEAVAHYALRDLDAALKCAQEALGIEPAFSGARRLKATIEEQLA